MAERWVLHCDCNSFYASVELLSRPELRQKPVAVCGDPASRHGIILAKNEPAKAFGVRTAETIWQARTLFCWSLTGSGMSIITRSSTRSTAASPTGWSPSASTRAGWT